jgi:glycosyltransferase involved in cell wall biosynthesis
MTTLTIIIAAKNEARNISDCVQSASFADEVIVLDSGSTDGTQQLAEAAGALVVATDWPGYGPQQSR